MGDLKAFFVFTKSDGSREVKEFPRRKAAPLNFFYEQIQIFVCASNGLVPLAIAWGD